MVYFSLFLVHSLSPSEKRERITVITEAIRQPLRDAVHVYISAVFGLCIIRN